MHEDIQVILNEEIPQFPRWDVGNSQACPDCGHFHQGDCPEVPEIPCGDYRCCIN